MYFLYVKEKTILKILGESLFIHLLLDLIIVVVKNEKVGEMEIKFHQEGRFDTMNLMH